MAKPRNRNNPQQPNEEPKVSENIQQNPGEDENPTPEELAGADDAPRERTAVNRGEAPAKPKSAFPKAVLLQAAEFGAMEDYMTVLGERPWDAPMTWKELTKRTKDFLQNFGSRGLLDVSYNEDHGGVDSIVLTERGHQSLLQARSGSLKQTPGRRASEGGAAAPRQQGAREPRARDSYLHNPDYRIKKLASSNPRREKTHGAYNWDLYRDGMTYADYMKAPFDAELKTSTDAAFYGPHPGQLNWDLMQGFIGIYDVNQPETLELKDGRQITNPEYWVVKNRMRAPEKKGAEPAAQQKAAE